MHVDGVNQTVVGTALKVLQIFLNLKLYQKLIITLDLKQMAKNAQDLMLFIKVTLNWKGALKQEKEEKQREKKHCLNQVYQTMKNNML